MLNTGVDLPDLWIAVVSVHWYNAQQSSALTIRVRISDGNDVSTKFEHTLKYLKHNQTQTHLKNKKNKLDSSQV